MTVFRQISYNSSAMNPQRAKMFATAELNGNRTAGRLNPPIPSADKFSFSSSSSCSSSNVSLQNRSAIHRIMPTSLAKPEIKQNSERIQVNPGKSNQIQDKNLQSPSMAGQNCRFTGVASPTPRLAWP